MISRVLPVVMSALLLSACGVSKYEFTSDVGATGATGAQGNTGAVGATGAAGSAGTNGVNGTNGTNGTNGVNGATGAQGATGAAGTQGAAGAKGNTGATGAVGATGAAGSNGTSGVNGSTGTQGATGAAGAGFTSGLLCDFYTVLAADESSPVNWDKMLSDGTFQFTTTIGNFDVVNQSSTDVFPGLTLAQQTQLGYTNYALDCEGYLDIPETGDYNFTLASDDGSEMAIDDNVIINMPEQQAITSQTVTNVSLFSGRHKFNMIYFQGPPVMIGLTLQWQGPSNQGLGSLSTVPVSAFSH
jgi:hypothetical protein